MLIHDSYPDVQLFHSLLCGDFPSPWLQLLQWSRVTTRCAWPGLGESVTELMPFMNFLVHSYTCCSERHASPYRSFIRCWILMGFTPSLPKKRMTERCSSLVHTANGAAIFTLLLHRRVAFLHRTATVCHSSNHQYHCCQLTRQSSCVSNFYRTFKVFIWLSLVLIRGTFFTTAFRKNVVTD